MAKPETYQYSPLLTKNSIRLLLLQPGAPGSDIHCSLIHSTLRDMHDDIYQHYIALSYVWGDASKTRTVFVDHTPFQATVNLAAALEDLRHPQMVLRLWADAICINQSNILERNHQVGLMRDIYSLAQHTVIHLGERKEECDEVLNAALRGTLNSPHRQLAIDQVLSRPWFTRVWIYQELVLSKDPWVQCGRTRIRWDALYAAICPGEDPQSSGFDGDSDGDPEGDLIKGSGDNEPIHSDAVVDERGLIQLFSGMHKARKGQPETPTLFEVMLSRRGFGVSDPRDLVYGHLAVARLPSKNNIPACPVVDYQRSIAEVFTEATAYILKRTDYNETLHLSDVRTPSRRLKGLPSWVPDW
ncbi:HET-domain-containing protein, partial [Hyaloscypha variabilis F]